MTNRHEYTNTRVLFHEEVFKRSKTKSFPPFFSRRDGISAGAGISGWLHLQQKIIILKE